MLDSGRKSRSTCSTLTFPTLGPVMTVLAAWDSCSDCSWKCCLHSCPSSGMRPVSASWRPRASADSHPCLHTQLLLAWKAARLTPEKSRVLLSLLLASHMLPLWGMCTLSSHQQRRSQLLPESNILSPLLSSCPFILSSVCLSVYLPLYAHAHLLPWHICSGQRTVCTVCSLFLLCRSQGLVTL